MSNEYPTDDPIPNARLTEDLFNRPPATFPGVGASESEAHFSEPPATFTITTSIMGANISGQTSLRQRLQAAQEMERTLTLSIDTQVRDQSGRLTSWAVNMRQCSQIMLGRHQRHLHVTLRWSDTEGNWVCVAGSQNPSQTSR